MTALSLEILPIILTLDGFNKIFVIAFLIDTALLVFIKIPFLLFSTTMRQPEILVAIIGLPQAAASNKTFGTPS